jgi:hypothetical protein
MSTRNHDAPGVKVHQSTGSHRFIQRRKTHASTKYPSAGGAPGHWTVQNKNEVQRFTIVGNPTGGTFTATFKGQTTAPIAYNATADDLRTALEGLLTIGAGNVAASGPAGGAWTITLQGALQKSNQPLFTTDATGLTGGDEAAVEVLLIQDGATNGTQRRPVGKNDDDWSMWTIEAESPAPGGLQTDPTAVGSSGIWEGPVTVPQPPPGAEEKTRYLWTNKHRRHPLVTMPKS